MIPKQRKIHSILCCNLRLTQPHSNGLTPIEFRILLSCHYAYYNSMPPKKRKQTVCSSDFRLSWKEFRYRPTDKRAGFLANAYALQRRSRRVRTLLTLAVHWQMCRRRPEQTGWDALCSQLWFNPLPTWLASTNFVRPITQITAVPTMRLLLWKRK